jgi:hypothetical protein
MGRAYFGRFSDFYLHQTGFNAVGLIRAIILRLLLRWEFLMWVGPHSDGLPQLLLAHI